MEVARTSMIHAVAPHFLWPFAVQYAAHQLNLWPRVSLPETWPTLRWTGKVGDASRFRVWGARAFVRDTIADKLSPRAIPCVFLGFVPDAPGWQFYHPNLRRVFPSQDVTFDESVPFYHLFPLCPSPPPAALPCSRSPSAVDSGAAQGAASGGAASGGAEPEGADSEGSEIGGAEPGGVATGGGEPGGAEPEGVEPGGAESGGAEPQGAASSGGFAATSAGGAGPARAGGTGVAARAGVIGGAATTSPGGAHTQGTGAAGTGGVEGAGAGDLTKSGATGAGGLTKSGATSAGGAGAGGAGVGGPRAGVAGVGGPGVGGAGAGGAGAVDPGGAERPRPYFVPLLQQVLGTLPSAALTPPLLCPPPDKSQPPLQPASPLPTPSPYAEQSGGLTKRREPVSRPVSPVRTARRVPRSCPPPVPGTHAMTLRPSSVPLRVPLPAPPESSLPEVFDPESNCAHTASPTDSHLLATSSGYILSLPCCFLLRETRMLLTSQPRSLTVKWPQGSAPAFKARYVARGFSQQQGVDDFHTFSPTPKMTTLRVFLALSGLQHSWSLRRPVHGLRQAPREWHNTLRTTLADLGFAPAIANLSLFLRTDTSLPPFYVLVYVNDLVFATADTEALTLVKSELQRRHTCTDLGELRSYLGLQITRPSALRLPVLLATAHSSVYQPLALSSTFERV
ncbi:unnamed protein product, partial [Closterium sp. NIES-53]